MMDQVRGLEWVKANIGAFGGDSTRVSIGGQSAGAASVSWHVVSSVSAGLFERAACFSGCFANWTVTPRHIALSDAKSLFSATKCNSFRCLQRLPAQTLLSQSQFGSWGPVIDGILTTGYPLAELSKSNKSQKLLMGSVRDDGSGFCGQKKTLSRSELLHYLQGAFSLNVSAAAHAAEMYLSIVPTDTLCNCTANFLAAEYAYSDNQFFCFARRAAELVPASRLYFWNYVPKGSAFFIHAEDIPYWFNVESLLPSHEATHVSDNVSSVLSEFVKGTLTLPAFPRMWNVTASGIKIIGDALAKRCSFWESHDDTYPTKSPLDDNND